VSLLSEPVRVMVEQGWKKKRWVACAFDWPGWDRYAKSEDRAQLYQDRQIFCDYTLGETGERGCGVLELGKYLVT